VKTLKSFPKYYFIIIFISLLSVTSCRTGPHPEFNPDNGQGGGVSKVTISVSAPDGSPVTDARVYFGGALFTTGADGSIDIGSIGKGTYEISVSHPDYMFYSDRVDVPSGTYTLNVNLLTESPDFSIVQVIPGLSESDPHSNGTFTIEFNKTLDPPLLTSSFFEFAPNSGNYSISIDGATATLTFKQEWTPGQTIRWNVNKGIVSATSDILKTAYFGQFKVSQIDLTPPRLVQSTPSEGATNVFRNQKISFVFSDTIDPLSITTSSIVVTPPITFSTVVDSRTVNLQYSGLLQADANYTVTISNLRDENGNALTSPVSVSFTTGTRTRRFRYRNADWTRVGDRIVFESDEDGNFDLWEIKSDGSGLRQLTTNASDELHPRYSYDGSQVVFERQVDDYWQIFRLDVETGQEVQVTSGSDNFRSPVYSATYERRIAYVSDFGDEWSLWSSEEDGSVPREWMTGFGRGVSDPDYHPFLETQIAFAADGGLSRDIFKAVGFPGDAETTWVNLTNEIAGEDSTPCFSPEGDIIAFISNTGGIKNIWLMDFEGLFPRQLTTSETDLDRPVYSPNFGDHTILADVTGDNNAVSLAFFDAVDGQLLSYLIGGEE
jgi:Tol biopolymer transport system component